MCATEDPHRPQTLATTTTTTTATNTTNTTNATPHPLMPGPAVERASVCQRDWRARYAAAAVHDPSSAAVVGRRASASVCDSHHLRCVCPALPRPPPPVRALSCIARRSRPLWLWVPIAAFTCLLRATTTRVPPHPPTPAPAPAPGLRSPQVLSVSCAAGCYPCHPSRGPCHRCMILGHCSLGLLLSRSNLRVVCPSARLPVCSSSAPYCHSFPCQICSRWPCPSSLPRWLPTRRPTWSSLASRCGARPILAHPCRRCGRAS